MLSSLWVIEMCVLMHHLRLVGRADQRPRLVPRPGQWGAFADWPNAANRCVPGGRRRGLDGEGFGTAEVTVACSSTSRIRMLGSTAKRWWATWSQGANEVWLIKLVPDRARSIDVEPDRTQSLAGRTPTWIYVDHSFSGSI